MIVLPDSLPEQTVELIRGVQADLPIIENPLGSNRSPEIDEMCKRYGVPLGSAWCALWLAESRQSVGYEIPPTVGDCHPARAESWHQWAISTKRLTQTPQLGFATLYDFTGSGKADHVGTCIMSLTPIVMNAEGNTSLDGVSRDGAIATIKPVRAKFVLGYIALVPIP